MVLPTFIPRKIGYIHSKHWNLFQLRCIWRDTIGFPAFSDGFCGWTSPTLAPPQWFLHWCQGLGPQSRRIWQGIDVVLSEIMWEQDGTSRYKSVIIMLPLKWPYISIHYRRSLEVKLPTIWTDEKQSRAEAERRERLEERRVEEKESEERRCRCAKR